MCDLCHPIALYFSSFQYVDFRMGSESGYIRFEDADGSRMARAAAVLAVEGGVIVKNFITILDPLQGKQAAVIISINITVGLIFTSYWIVSR